MSFSGRERNKLFVRASDGWTEMGYLGGADSILDGRAAAKADFDHDGDEDIAVVSRNAPLLTLFRNESAGTVARVIGVAIAGEPGERSSVDAIGAKAVLSACGVEELRVVVGSDGFAAQSSRVLTFAIPRDCADKATLRISWPSGRVRRFDGVEPGQLYDVGEKTPLRARAGYYATRPLTPAKAASWTVLLGDSARPAPRLVVLWASWCAACKAHVPELNQIAAAGLDVIAVSVEPSDDQARAALYARANRATYPVMPYDAPLATALLAEFGDRLPPLPSSILVDAAGAIAWIGPGLPTASQRAKLSSSPPRPRRAWPFILAALVLALAGLGLAARRRRKN